MFACEDGRDLLEGEEEKVPKEPWDHRVQLGYKELWDRQDAVENKELWDHQASEEKRELKEISGCRGSQGLKVSPENRFLYLK